MEPGQDAYRNSVSHQERSNGRLPCIYELLLPQEAPYVGSCTPEEDSRCHRTGDGGSRPRCSRGYRAALDAEPHNLAREHSFGIRQRTSERC